MTGGRKQGSGWTAPLGPVLTLTIVLWASLAPQPAGASATSAARDATGGTAVRGQTHGDLAFSWALWLEHAGGQLTPTHEWPEIRAAGGAAAPYSPAVLPPPPSAPANVPRGP